MTEDVVERARRNGAVLVPLATAFVAGVLTTAYAVHDHRRALLAFIAAYGLGVATTLAGMVLVMVLHLTGARWWLVLRRVFVVIAGTTPIFAALFVPIGAAMSLVYPWWSPPPGLPDHVESALAHQRAWQEPSFFLVRSLVYLASWTILSVLLRRTDAAHALRPSASLSRTEKRISAVGLPILAFTLTFAAFDWLMSLQPGWVSNMFGLYVFTSGLVTALSVLAIASWLAVRSGALPGVVGPDHGHAIGRLILMSVVLWAYIAFFQLLLVWIADLPHEVAFYQARSQGSWRVVDGLLFGGRFVVPFFVLLPRRSKRSPALLAALGVWLLMTSILDFAWLTLGSLGARLALADLAPFVFVVALAWAYGAHLWNLRGRAAETAPATVADPALEEALRYRSL